MNNFIFLLIPFFGYTQVGINTNKPTKELDVNGEISVRKLPISNNVNDLELFANSEGVLQKKEHRNVFFAGNLAGNFISAESTNSIDRITNFNVLYNTNNFFDTSTSSFTIPKTGIYSIIFSTTMQRRGSASRSYTVGIVQESDRSWVQPFTIGVNNAPSNTQKNSYTFTGLVTLEQGVKYYFGTTGYATHVAYAVEKATSTYFELKLIKEL